jgi:hypothetical protein
MSEYGNTDLIRGLLKTLLGEDYFSCDNQDKSLSDAFRQALVLGTDGYPALRIAGDVVNECAELLDAYFAYVEGDGGAVTNAIDTKTIICWLVE